VDAVQELPDAWRNALRLLIASDAQLNDCDLRYKTWKAKILKTVFPKYNRGGMGLRDEAGGSTFSKNIEKRVARASFGPKHRQRSTRGIQK
jgi:hypothetical protein